MCDCAEDSENESNNVVNIDDNSETLSVCSNKHFTNVDDNSEISINKNVTNIDDNSETLMRLENRVTNVDDASETSSICSNYITNTNNFQETSTIYSRNSNHITNVSDLLYSIIGDTNSTFSEHSSEHQSQHSNIIFSYKNKKISLTETDIYPLESNIQTITIAALFNYSDDKDEANFENIYLPEIKMSYKNLIKLFFVKCGKRFSPYILNQIWKGIKGLSLTNIFLKTFSSVYNTDYEELTASAKIKLYKECSFSKITTKAYKINSLNLEELNNALGSVESRMDGSLSSNIIFHLYSPTLNVGVKVILKIIISDVPECVRGVINDENSIEFDFSNYK